MKYYNPLFLFLFFLLPVSASAAPPSDWHLTYSNEDGSGRAAVGNGEDRNSYRGVYWTGVDKTLEGVEVFLDYWGNISSIDYKVTVWEVDEENDLEMKTLLMSSDIVSGADIIQGWNCFSFPSDVLLTTGKTVVVISRTDPETLDSSSYILVKNGYDSADEESSQWNIHYGSNKKMAGRRGWDEDQPEYFTFGIRFYGSNADVSVNDQYPNIPEDIQATPLSHDSINISWVERGENNVPVDHYNIYEYSVSDGDLISESLIGTSVNTSYVHSGLETESTHTYVVRAVSAGGNEGYHSLDNGGLWTAETLSQAIDPVTEIPEVPEITSLNIFSSDVIRVNWYHTSTVVNEESGFILERRIGNGTFIEIGSAGQNSSSYNDSGLIEGTEYRYRVKAFNDIGESAYSNIISGVTAGGEDNSPDLNGDGIVNILDVVYCVIAINQGMLADVDGDNDTDKADLLIITHSITENQGEG